MAGLDRRRFLRTAVVTVGAAAVLEPLAFTAAAPGAERTRTLTGQIPYGAPDWLYVPVEVPPAVNRLSVRYDYDRPIPPAGFAGNALDMGVFDQRGYGQRRQVGFRGWSGGFRDSFTISASEATPGYLPGPIGTGTWYLVLGPYQVLPQGLDWTITVTLGFGSNGPAFVPRPAPSRAVGRGLSWYRGDLHVHTVHSDGRRSPAEVAAGARAAGLDFLVSTDHNTSSASGVWGDFAGPDLLVIDGEEVTTRNGHYTAVGLPAGTWIDWRYRAVDGALSHFLRDIHRVGGLAVAAHPLSPCVACGWKFGYAGMDAVEVWSGPWTADDEAVVASWDNLLVAEPGAKGFLPAVGSSDAHSEPQVIGLPQTVVHAPDLDRDSILRGVRAGRCWLAESSTVDLTFTATGAGRQVGVGQRLEVSDDTEVSVDLVVSGAPGTAVRLVTDQGQRLLAPLPASGAVSWTTTPRSSRYVRAEVRRPQPTATTPDTMVALTNPIFLGTA
jgi:hypothetical protein